MNDLYLILLKRKVLMCLVLLKTMCMPNDINNSFYLREFYGILDKIY